MAHSIEKRNRILSEKLNGKSLRQISEEQGISYSSVKRIWRSIKATDYKVPPLSYSNCGPKRPSYYRMYRLSTWLKRLHPSWGAPYILAILSARYPDEALPSIRSVQKWFRRNRLTKLRIVHPILSFASSVDLVHDCWQIDAKEKVVLEDGTKVCYLTMVDVKSGGLLATPIFSLCSDEFGQCLGGTKCSHRSI